MTEGAAIYVAAPAGRLHLTFLQAFVDAGWRLHESLAWVKDRFVLGHSDYHYQHEPILVGDVVTEVRPDRYHQQPIMYGYAQGGGRRGRGGAGWYGDNSQSSVLEFPRPSSSQEHPTMKPVALVAYCLGNASDQFSLIYHETMGEIMEALTGEGLKFETAGSCRGGRQVWALGYLDEPYTIAGDDTEHLPFLALLNNHDGSGACKVTMTQVRVVCWNTFQAASAEGKRTGREFSFRHVGDVMGRVEDAKAALAGLREETDEYVALAAELTDIKIDDEMVGRYLTDFLPDPGENGEQASDRVRGNVARARSMFKAIYNDSVTVEALKGNGFGLLQASTEYLDHVREYRSTDSYLGRSILRAEPAKAKAVQLIRGLV